MMIERTINQFMRRQAVAFELGVGRHTIGRLLKTDASFPKFFQITPGVEVIARVDFENWLRSKRLQALVNKTQPKATACNTVQPKTT